MPRMLLITLIFGLGLFLFASVAEIQSQKRSEENTKLAESQTNKDGIVAHALESFALKNSKSSDKLAGEEEGQINFLFLGIGGEEHVSGNYLTDTIILALFAPQSKRTAIISIPRDLLVRSPKTNSFLKLNALYAADPSGRGFPGPMGIDAAREKITEITGLPIHYYAVLDLEGIEKIVDALGGIYVRREEDLLDNRFPDKNYGYETYTISEGWRYLDGKEAAKYIRTRHTAGGDFDRMRRQQEVARAIKKKAEGLKSLFGLPKLLAVYQTLKKHLFTNMELQEVSRLLELGEGLKEKDIIFEQITAEAGGSLVYDRIELGGKAASVLKPKAGLENYEEIRASISNITEKLKMKNEK